jgi:hypothetical protein
MHQNGEHDFSGCICKAIDCVIRKLQIADAFVTDQLQILYTDKNVKL